MKKSKIAKLSLMGASIAALAATLTTSTYAWYVSNKTATISEATGQTAAGAADGSILLSWDNSDNSYYKTLGWGDTNAPGATVASAAGVFKEQLTPLYYVAANSSFTSINSYKPTEDTTYDSSKTYYTKASTTYTEASISAFANGVTYYEKVSTANAQTSGFVRFSMYIKADKTTTVTVTPTMANTTASSDYNSLKQIAYEATGSIGKGQPFIVDAFDAMYYSLNVDDATTETAVVAAPTSGKSVTGAVAPGAAHSYYEAVTGEDIEAQYEVAPVTQALTTLTVGTTPVKLTWTIWLAGNDLDCYNSCAGQSFSFALTFKA